MLTSRLRTVAALALLCGAGAELLAQDPVYLYALNERGKMSVSGTVIESLPGQYNPNDAANPHGEHRWVDLVVVGRDRWALRLDGRVEFNGSKLTQALPFSLDDGAPLWARLAVVDGEIRVLRTDGLVWDASAEIAAYEAGPSFFSDFVASGTSLYALRIDGHLFRDAQATPVARFEAGAGLLPGSLDGSAPDTWWVRLQMDAATGLLVALRSDGNVHTIDPVALPEGEPPPELPVSTELATLPFPTNVALLDEGDFYIDREVLADESWLALTQDGRLVQSTDTGNFLANLPGGVGSEGTTFVDLLSFGDAYWSLRFDGKLFQEVDTSPIIDLPQGRYLTLDASDLVPDLEGAINRKPVASVYKTRLVEGATAASVPVIVSDVDKAAGDLLLEFDFEKLPGATLAEGVGGLPEVLVPDGLPVGKYRFVVSVDDGITNKPRVFKYPVRVLPLDDNVEKNRKPMPTKVKRLQALVGTELVVPLLVADRDGDVVSVEPVADKGVFLRDAAFDALTNTLTWTPAFEDIGKTFASFRVSDGTKISRLKLRIVVYNPLIF